MTALSARMELALRACPGKGRGVFATKTILSGSVIEQAPTLHLSSDDCEQLEQTGIGDYYFAHPDNEEDGLLPLGISTLLNHADDPNAETRWYSEEDIGWMVHLVAVRDIFAGEEITRRYRCPPWFEVVE